MKRATADWIYAGLDLLLAGLYLLVFFHLAPSREPAFTAVVVALCALLAAGGLGMLTPRWGLGRKISAAACVVMLTACVALITLLLFSAAYLHGIYNGIGEAGAAIALLVAAVAIEAVGLIPGLQLAYLLRRRREERASA